MKLSMKGKRKRRRGERRKVDVHLHRSGSGIYLMEGRFWGSSGVESRV
jgi:hypothetical protein